MVTSVVEESQIGKTELAGWGGGPTFLGVSESASLKGAERREGALQPSVCQDTGAGLCSARSRDVQEASVAEVE